MSKLQIHLRGFQGSPDSPWEPSAEDPYWKEINSSVDLLGQAASADDAEESVIGTETSSDNVVASKGARDKSNSATLL